MSFQDSKKLKRGLKDISPLFEDRSKPVNRLESSFETFKPVSRPQSISFWSAESSQGRTLLNSKMAARVQSKGCESLLISLKSEIMPAANLELPPGQKHYSLSLDQFEIICRSDLKPVEGFENAVLFFDFDYSNPVHFEKVIPMLDKWILLVGPELESLTEVFRFLKASMPLHKNLEYYFMAQTKDEKIAESLYEKFSDMVSRRLGIAMNWLGLYETGKPEQQGEALYEILQSGPVHDSVEKRAFTGLAFPRTGNN